MPQLNPDKCYAQQPQRLAITMPEKLLSQWLTDFYELLAVQLKLDDETAVVADVDYATNQEVMLTAKGKFFKELKRHTGESSTYTYKSNLLESLAKLYAVFTHTDTTSEQKNFIAGRIAEDVVECSPGFHDRVSFTLIRLNIPQNLDELLAQVRFNLVDKIAHILADKSAQGIHVHARMNKLAQAAGFSVWTINENDTYERVGSRDISDETIIQKLQDGFNRHFQCFAIINALCEEITSLIAPLGYNGKRETGEAYKNGEDDKFFDVLSLFISLDKGMAFERNAGKVTDIDWQYVRTTFLQTLTSRAYVTLFQEERALLDGLLQHERKPWDTKSLYQLIPDAYELAACLQFFSEWSLEQKAELVLAYLHPKPSSVQTEILTILNNETPQLTAQLKTEPRLQAMYFEIAIADKDVAAVKTYVEQGTDINAALQILFNPEHKRETLYWLHDNPLLLQKLTATGMNTVIGQGKYQGKTIAETLVSTKKGRQLVLENNTLQILLSETSIANTLSDHLQQAQIERNTVNTELGFFKKSDPLAIQLVQWIVYGDLKKSEDLLKDNPLLLRTLLTEKVTVKDYSRRKVKQTAFGAALCAMDDELCEMLAHYMTQEEMDSQYQAIFPAGHEAYYQAQTAFDFTQIVTIITNSNAADVEKALSLELPNDTLLWVTLEQFRADFTKRSNQEVVFNPQHLLKAFELYDEKYDNWTSKQQDLFWRQVVGYVQRFLPANIAMDFAQGLYGRGEYKLKSNRSLNFRYGEGSMFPLSVGSSLSGLGYSRAAGGYGRFGTGGSWHAGDRGEAFSKLMSSKNSSLGRIMRPELRDSHPSWCVIQ